MAARSSLAPYAFVIPCMLQTREQDMFVAPALARCIAAQSHPASAVVVVVPAEDAACVSEDVLRAFACVAAKGIPLAAVACARESSAGSSRNAGVEYLMRDKTAAGEVECVMFVDGDDLISSCYAECIVKDMEFAVRLRLPCVHVHCAGENARGLNVIRNAPAVPGARVVRVTSCRAYEGIAEHDKVIVWDPCCATACLAVGYACYGHAAYTVRVFGDGLRFSSASRRGEDWDLVRRVGLAGVVLASSDVLSAYLRWSLPCTDAAGLRAHVSAFTGEGRLRA